MTYRYLGNDTFQITLTVYRDCANGIPPFDNPVSVGVFDSNNNILDTIEIALTSQSDITNSIYNCLPVAPSTICYQKGEYIFNLFLPPISGGYQISYQRCCRPSTIVNIVGPWAGFSIYTKTPDSLWYSNSSPEFNLDPFSFICVNSPFVFDNSAYDIDGDSLVYSLCTPFDGATNLDPLPNPPASPPYLSISWMPPYNLADIIGGPSPLIIDEQTGILSLTPNAEGIYTYGISVKEYRGGIYLGETRRDNTMYVITPVGISEPDVAVISISPNPLSGRSTIHIDENINLKDASFEINDALGRMVLEIGNVTSNDFVFDVSQLQPGIYLYRMMSDGLTLTTGRLVVE